MSLKERISSPLEAGTSILDAHHLPPHVLPALEYVSERLSRKALHLSLVVVRSEYQLSPSATATTSTATTPLQPPGLQTPTTPGTPGTPSKMRFSALRQLVRSSSSRSTSSTASSTKSLWLDTRRTRGCSTNSSSNNSCSSSSVTPGSPRVWPMTPVTPMTPMSPPPLTPASSIASMTTASTAASGEGGMAMGPGGSSWGLRFVHAPGLPPREKKIITAVMDKAMRRFDLGREWLPAPMAPSSCGLTDQLIQRSLVQNDTLFSAEGLHLVSLDSLYSLKSALSAYTKTRHPSRLEDAVDELRRIVLAHNGRKVARSALLRSYDWLSVSHEAIGDLDRMYKRAYGGPEGCGAVAGMGAVSCKRHQTLLEPFIRPDDESRLDQQQQEAEEGRRREAAEVEVEVEVEEDVELALSMTPTPSAAATKTLTPRAAPTLKLQTNFDTAEEEDEDRTARPADHIPFMLQAWPVSSISQVLSATGLSPGGNSRSPTMRLGPKTPNGYEDISPITRGEWGFLTTDNIFRSGRTAAVETFS